MSSAPTSIDRQLHHPLATGPPTSPGCEPSGGGLTLWRTNGIVPLRRASSRLGAERACRRPLILGVGPPAIALVVPRPGGAFRERERWSGLRPLGRDALGSRPAEILVQSDD